MEGAGQRDYCCSKRRNPIHNFESVIYTTQNTTASNLLFGIESDVGILVLLGGTFAENVNLNCLILILIIGQHGEKRYAIARGINITCYDAVRTVIIR